MKPGRAPAAPRAPAGTGGPPSSAAGPGSVGGRASGQETWRECQHDVAPARGKGRRERERRGGQTTMALCFTKED